MIISCKFCGKVCKSIQGVNLHINGSPKCEAGRKTLRPGTCTNGVFIPGEKFWTETEDAPADDWYARDNARIAEIQARKAARK